MSMVSPKSIEEINKIVSARKQHELIEIDRDVMLGILAEVMQLQKAITVPDGIKIDLIQKMSMEFAWVGVIDTLKTMATNDWGSLSPADALLMTASRLETMLNQKAAADVKGHA